MYIHFSTILSLLRKTFTFCKTLVILKEKKKTLVVLAFEFRRKRNDRIYFENDSL